MKKALPVIFGALALGAHAARAQPPGDAYCDHVEAVASSESAVLMGPELFGSIGWIEGSDTTVSIATNNQARLIGGVRIKLGGIYQGLVTRDHARADCRRHQAIDQVVGASQSLALQARVKAIEDALPEAQKFLADAMQDLDARRANAQDVTATRLRVEELRQLDEDARRELQALPPLEGRLDGAMAAYYTADADMERDEGKLRAAQGWDVQVRFGIDEFLSQDTPQPWFAAVTASFDLGWLYEGAANRRAAVARARVAREAHVDDPIGATMVQLQTVLATEEKREAETRALVADLARQLKELHDLGGEQTKRYRETVWFEWVKANADHEYLATHVASLREVLGKQAAEADGGPP
jgi:hypothetical protein